MEINRRTLLAGGAALAGLSCGIVEAKAGDAAISEVPKDGIILTAMVKARAGEEEAVKEALLSLVGPTRQEAGCLCYNLHQSKTDPTLFMFYEQWANQDAIDAHGNTPHMKALGSKLKDRTDKGGGVVLYELLK
ncbi:MAG: putative quinol monooxygenase [Pirellulaceae bacterium]